LSSSNIIKSLGRILLQTFVVMIFIFFASRLSQNDLAKTILQTKGIEPTFSGYKKAYERERDLLGLNKPVFYFSVVEDKIGDFPFPRLLWNGANNQLHSYLSNIIRLDFGNSRIDGKPVFQKITKALHWSIPAIFLATLLSYLLTILLGRIWHRERKINSAIDSLLIIFYSMPLFWIATLMVIYLSSPMYGLHLFSIASYDLQPSFFEKVVRLWPMIVCITISELAYYLTIYKSNLAVESSKPYKTTLLAKGLDMSLVVNRHIGPNAMSPIITSLVGSIPAAFSGMILVENIFNIPGIGRLLWQSYESADWSVLYGAVFIISLVCALSFHLVDLLQSAYQPKTKEYEQT
jgi:peptide/nickel transport system permease protein